MNSIEIQTTIPLFGLDIPFTFSKHMQMYTQHRYKLSICVRLSCFQWPCPLSITRCHSPELMTRPLRENIVLARTFSASIIGNCIFSPRSVQIDFLYCISRVYYEFVIFLDSVLTCVARLHFNRVFCYCYCLSVLPYMYYGLINHKEKRENRPSAY